MVELWPNISTDFFDGNKVLDALLNPPKPVARFVLPVADVESKPVDETDSKLISYLMGRKVCFSEEELDKYIIE